MKRKRRPSYYRLYEAAHINNSRFLIREARTVVKKLGPPYQRNKRGRPLKLDPEKAAVLVIVMAAQGRTFRQAEDLGHLLHSEGVDHVTIWRYFTRITTDYVQHAVQLLFNLLGILQREALLILDSTGISCDRSGDALKLHVLAAYHPGSGVLAIARAEVTGFNVHDVTQAERLLIHGDGGLLLGDAAYDSHRLRVKARRLGLLPCIKFKRTTAPTKKELARGFSFDRERYRLRGLVEGVFGGMETRYGNATRCRLQGNRELDVLLKALGHNLRVYMRAKTNEKLLITLIYETTP